MPRFGRRGRTRSVTAADIDRGLQPERTTLAWSRTWMALITVSAVFLRWTPHYGLAMLALPAGTLLAASAILATQRRRIARGVRGIRSNRMAADPLPPLGLVTLMLVLGVAGLTFVLNTR